MTAHVPSLAAGEDARPRRSLLLAGGGIRVAYQAGVLVALEEAGLRFSHIDGTSGGTFNVAMLLSGITPNEACARWRGLKLGGFVSLWPPRRLLAGPPFPALGSSAGIRRRVFPALGVDVARMRGAHGIDGTFNVCDFVTKECLAVPHTEADLDVLTAGVSLPIVSPAVEREGRVLIDAVWIKDANVAEAVRRGSEELWLVWCIGNHGRYRDGAFQQYVHMIEIAANGALQQELELVREQGRTLHVIRPRVPLPLDPDFFFGRIDAATLIAMGYRDAAAYLDAPHEAGVPPDGSATRMQDPVPGAAFRERLRGEGTELHLTWEVDDLEAFMAAPRGTVVGDVTHPGLGARRLIRSGTFRVEDGNAIAELHVAGERLELRRRLADFGVVEARFGSGPPLALERVAAPAWWMLHARGVSTLRAGAAVRARFARWLRLERRR